MSAARIATASRAVTGTVLHAYDKIHNMKYKMMILLCSLLLTLSGSWVQAQDPVSDLLGRINNLRASLGLPGYTLNPALNAAAQSQAQWMAETGSISHNRPDGSSPRSRAISAGYTTTDVSENIYGGSNASVGVAWTFWVNSPVHYNGLVNPRYSDVGIGVASGSIGRAYVLVFGNPGGPPPYVPPPVSASNGGSGASAPPSYVLGLDEHGNIMHQIQNGDTLGDIALLYGYTWDDLPYMRELNNIENHFALKPGEIFLVPPYEGTYTPTPGDPPESAATPEAQDAEATEEADAPNPTEAPTNTPEATATPSPSPTATFVAGATSAAMPESIVIAANPTDLADPAQATPDFTPTATPEILEVSAAGSIITPESGTSPWLIIALVIQAGVVIGAGVEFLRRATKGKKR